VRTEKRESDAHVVSHQVQIHLTLKFLESQEEILSFEPHFKEGSLSYEDRVEVDSIPWVKIWNAREPILFCIVTQLIYMYIYSVRVPDREQRGGV